MIGADAWRGLCLAAAFAIVLLLLPTARAQVADNASERMLQADSKALAFAAFEFLPKGSALDCVVAFRFTPRDVEPDNRARTWGAPIHALLLSYAREADPRLALSVGVGTNPAYFVLPADCEWRQEIAEDFAAYANRAQTAWRISAFPPKRNEPEAYAGRSLARVFAIGQKELEARRLAFSQPCDPSGWLALAAFKEKQAGRGDAMSPARRNSADLYRAWIGYLNGADLSDAADMQIAERYVPLAIRILRRQAERTGCGRGGGSTEE